MVRSALAALDGVIAVIFGRTVAADAFDLSIRGFWASFGAVVLILPSFAVGLSAQARFIEMAPVDNGTLSIPAAIASLVAQWVALPVMLALLARPLGLAARYVGFIVVRNWAAVVISALVAVPALLFNLGLLGVEAFILLNLLAYVAAIVIQYRVIRRMLAPTAITAVGFVVLDVLLGVLLDATIIRLVG